MHRFIDPLSLFGVDVADGGSGDLSSSLICFVSDYGIYQIAEHTLELPVRRAGLLDLVGARGVGSFVGVYGV